MGRSVLDTERPLWGHMGAGWRPRRRLSRDTEGRTELTRGSGHAVGVRERAGKEGPRGLALRDPGVEQLQGAHCPRWDARGMTGWVMSEEDQGQGLRRWL